MATTFDGANKRIILDSAAITASQIWTAWVDWLAADSTNCRWPLAFRQVGGDDLGAGLAIPPYLFLQNGWRVRPMEANHTLIITGNLFVEGGGVPVVQTLGNYNVSVQYTVPVQAQGIATSGSTGPSASDIASAVWSQLMGSGVAGTLLETAAEEAAKARKLQSNKAVILNDGANVTIYDDDTTTPLVEFTVSQDKNTRTPV